MCAVPEDCLAGEFYAQLLHWCRTPSDTLVLHLLLSVHSGVDHDVAVAYGKLAAGGDLLQAIAHDRIALSFEERAALHRFAASLRHLREATQTGADEAALSALAGQLFPRTPHLAATEAMDDDLVPAPASAREEPTGVPGRRGSFSASALNAYAECPRKWFYRYACGAVEDPASSASTYGTAFHAALEAFHEVFVQPSADEEPAMRRRIADDVANAFHRSAAEFETAVELELQRRRAQRTAQRYVTWLVEQARSAPFSVVGRELPVALDLDGYAFIGFIDRVDRDEATGDISILDYKTGNIAQSAAEYREKIRRFVEFQLPFYYWARTQAGDRVQRLALIPLKDAREEIHPIELVVGSLPQEASARKAGERRGTISIEELQAARDAMIDICARLSSNTIEYFPVAGDPAACTYCAYATACNNRPAAAGERFGR